MQKLSDGRSVVLDACGLQMIFFITFFIISSNDIFYRDLWVRKPNIP